MIFKDQDSTLKSMQGFKLMLLSHNRREVSNCIETFQSTTQQLSSSSLLFHALNPTTSAPSPSLSSGSSVVSNTPNLLWARVGAEHGQGMGGEKRFSAAAELSPVGQPALAAAAPAAGRRRWWAGRRGTAWPAPGSAGAAGRPPPAQPEPRGGQAAGGRALL